MEDKNRFILKGKAVDRYFDLNDSLMEFHKLFTYESKDDRTIAILGGTFLEMILEHILYAFFPEDEKEVEEMMLFNQPLGNFSGKIKMCYCLGLIDKVIKDDLNLVRKIRNEFAHNLYASFENDKLKSWCLALKWHRVLISSTPPLEANARDYFRVGVNSLIMHLNGCVSIARAEKRTIKNDF
ncbi:hypothetical protein [Echinicola vietnamensis]|uniref:Mannitol repressor n=1 Tax=Echinicola vietnamensis (strain DSM 17526 / LMG 23754 / KMM 6221) TaxID=926556 RepID=L0FV84_ECHVK|nr:hypothetical protein [Echinicola vietnamensis]AGA76666.1 hypothetical protein Echvi_0377 [Echinicola vietnamensis DSM 17526]